MVLEQQIRMKMRDVGWEAFRDSFLPRPDENIFGLERKGVPIDPEKKPFLEDQMAKLRWIRNILDSSRLVVRFEVVGDEIVAEHKLWLLMQHLEERPEFIPFVEGRL